MIWYCTVRPVRCGVPDCPTARVPDCYWSSSPLWGRGRGRPARDGPPRSCGHWCPRNYLRDTIVSMWYTGVQRGCERERCERERCERVRKGEKEEEEEEEECWWWCVIGICISPPRSCGHWCRRNYLRDTIGSMWYRGVQRGCERERWREGEREEEECW